MISKGKDQTFFSSEVWTSYTPTKQNQNTLKTYICNSWLTIDGMQLFPFIIIQFETFWYFESEADLST